MDRFFRIAKSVAVVAGVWAAGWSLVGLVLGIILGFMAILPFSFTLFLSMIVNSAVGFGVLGFGAGVVFSIALALLEWGAPAEELSTARVALSGAVGGGLIPVLMALSAVFDGAPLFVVPMALVIFSLLGAGTSLGMLRLLRSPARIQSETPTTT